MCKSSFTGPRIGLFSEAIFLLATGMHGIDYASEWICEWMELQGYDNSLLLELKVKAQYSTFMETLPFWIKMGIL